MGRAWDTQSITHNIYSRRSLVVQKTAGAGPVPALLEGHLHLKSEFLLPPGNVFISQSSHQAQNAWNEEIGQQRHCRDLHLVLPHPWCSSPTAHETTKNPPTGLQSIEKTWKTMKRSCLVLSPYVIVVFVFHHFVGFPYTYIYIHTYPIYIIYIYPCVYSIYYHIHIISMPLHTVPPFIRSAHLSADVQHGGGDVADRGPGATCVGGDHH